MSLTMSREKVKHADVGSLTFLIFKPYLAIILAVLPIQN
jgi:hypothetical protein